MPFDNQGFMLDPNGPQPERATFPKYPPQPQPQSTPDPQMQAFLDWRAQQPDAAPGAQTFPVTGMQDVTPQPAQPPSPLPQILTGPAAAAAGPSVLAQRLGVPQGQFSAREVGQNLSPQNAVNGSFTANDLSRYMRLGGGQIQDAAPQNVGLREAVLNKMIGIGQENQQIGIKQQDVDLKRADVYARLSQAGRQAAYEDYLLKQPGATPETVGAQMRRVRGQGLMQGDLTPLSGGGGNIGIENAPRSGNIGIAPPGRTGTDVNMQPPAATTGPVYEGIQPILDGIPGNNVGEYLRKLDNQRPGFVRENFDKIEPYLANRFGADKYDEASKGLNDFGQTPFGSYATDYFGPAGMLGGGGGLALRAAGQGGPATALLPGAGGVLGRLLAPLSVASTAIGLIPRAGTAIRQAVSGHSEEEKGRAALAALIAERRKRK